MTRLTSFLLPLILAAQGAAANEIPPEVLIDDASFTWSMSDITPARGLAEAKDAFAAEAFLVVTAPGGPLAGLTGRCLITRLIDRATQAERNTGICVYQDPQGDQLWETIEGATDGSAASFVGQGRWTGGTGRFEGATGQVTYEISVPASDGAGLALGTGVKSGILVPAGN